jgi:hypothetical protein
MMAMKRAEVPEERHYVLVQYNKTSGALEALRTANRGFTSYWVHSSTLCAEQLWEPRRPPARGYEWLFPRG